MSIFNFFNKKAKMNDNVSKKTNENVPILPCIEPITVRKPKMDAEEKFLLSYIDRIKNDEALKGLFPEIISKLEEELSKEEKEKLIEPIQNYEIREKRRRDTFGCLADEYNNAVNKKVQENYKTGKIEEFPLCKRLGPDEYEELKKLYPEEMTYLENLYFPIYEKDREEAFREKKIHFGVNKLIFDDLTEFSKFIEKINYYEGSRISDQYFNVVNDALNRYGKEMYGDNLSGIVKFYSFQYDNYLKVKSDIMSEIEILMDENMPEENKREAVIKIKRVSGYYLSKSEGTYMI